MNSRAISPDLATPARPDAPKPLLLTGPTQAKPHILEQDCYGCVDWFQFEHAAREALADGPTTPLAKN